MLEILSTEMNQRVICFKKLSLDTLSKHPMRFWSMPELWTPYNFNWIKTSADDLKTFMAFNRIYMNVTV